MAAGGIGLYEGQPCHQECGRPAASRLLVYGGSMTFGEGGVASGRGHFAEGAQSWTCL